MGKNVEKSKSKSQIESDKVFTKDIFTNFWFQIPEYQRSYVWGEDEISELIDDITFASENHPDDEYFLGSMVLQKKYTELRHKGDSIKYTEYDLLDGQQRLTTLLIMLAVIRDITINDDLKNNCTEYIFQKENKFKGIPERLRIAYKIRDNVENFIRDFIKEVDGTLKLDDLNQKAELKNVSVSNMAKAILQMHKYFQSLPPERLENFAVFLFNNVLLIYVSSEDLEDAFRLFTILNDRGVPLTNSDILKAWNLGAINNLSEKDKYAVFWEETESNFGRDEFDRLLSFLRTILVKEKARENILKEFEEKIYNAKPQLLSKGKGTMDLLKIYAEIYDQLIVFNNTPSSISKEFKNLITIMKYGLPSTDWIPPLLVYNRKFKDNNLLQFLKKLDNKASADWMTQLTPTMRIQNMNNILKVIDEANKPDKIISDANIFSIDYKTLKDRLNEDIYGRSFAKYILLKLEFIFKDHSSQFNSFNYISVEHVLPQNPARVSNWRKNFTNEQQEEWLHKIGNLVLLSRKKNSELNNKEFKEKKKKYFGDNIDSFPNSLKVMQYDDWAVDIVKDRQKEMIDKIMQHYKA